MTRCLSFDSLIHSLKSLLIEKFPSQSRDYSHMGLVSNIYKNDTNIDQLVGWSAGVSLVVTILVAAKILIPILSSSTRTKQPHNHIGNR